MGVLTPFFVFHVGWIGFPERAPTAVCGAVRTEHRLRSARLMLRAFQVLWVFRRPVSTVDNHTFFSDVSPSPSFSPLFSRHRPGWSPGGCGVRGWACSVGPSPSLTLWVGELLPPVSDTSCLLRSRKSRERERTPVSAPRLCSSSSIFWPSLLLWPALMGLCGRCWNTCHVWSRGKGR